MEKSKVRQLISRRKGVCSKERETIKCEAKESVERERGSPFSDQFDYQSSDCSLQRHLH